MLACDELQRHFTITLRFNRLYFEEEKSSIERIRLTDILLARTILSYEYIASTSHTPARNSLL